jgi:cytoskeletal protein RodZ
MRNRYLVLGLAAFMAVALAVPALGGPSNPIARTSASALTVAKKAKRKATAAQNSANAAQNTANEALSTANSAKTSATTAQNTADSAQTAATAAQAAADAANANANTRYDHVVHAEGTASPTNNADKSLVVANCAAAEDAATGGGWVVLGAGDHDAQVEYNSTFYNDQWVIIANDLGGDAGTWSVTPEAQCIGT